MESHKRNVRDSFDSKVFHYRNSRISLKSFQLQENTVIQMADGSFEDLLEVGSGVHGLINHFFSDYPQLKKYVAVDLSSRMIAQAREIYGNNKKVHLLQGDVEHLMFRLDHFDLIICMGVLEYLPDYRPALQEIWRVLEPGGILLLSVPLRRSLKFWITSIIDLVRKRIGPPEPTPFKVNRCIPSKLDRLLAQVSFEKLDAKKVNVEFYPLSELIPGFAGWLTKIVRPITHFTFFGFLQTQYVVKAQKISPLLNVS